LLAVSPDRLVAKTPLSIANSTDGGASWKELPIVPDQINPLVASPVAPYPLWGAAQAGGVWLVRSDDGVNWATTGATWPLFPDGASADVAYASGTGPTRLVQTADRGRTWQDLPTPTGGVGTLVATCPPPRSCIYVVQSTGSGTTTSVMSRSDDRGRTWSAPTAVTNWGTRSAIVVSPDDPKLLLQGRDGGVYQTRDGGGTWNYVPISGQGVVGVAFLSGSEVLAVSDTRQLLHSSNGGDDWTVVAPNPMPVGYTRGIVRSVLHPGTLFVLTGGGPDAPLFRSDDGGATWKPINRGLRSQYIPDQDAEVGHCVHHIAMNPKRPDVLFMQKHWDVMRSDDAGDNWKEVSGNLPTDFGFVIDIHAHEPETIYVVPITSDSLHYPPDGKLRVFRSRSGGNEWEPLTKGLPQKDCYVNVLRDAMAVDSLDKCGVYFGTTGGQVYASADAGDSWNPIVRDLPAVLSVEVQTLG
jgi:photosystem II stability/assembly factor-like uncharacterized protein